MKKIIFLTAVLGLLILFSGCARYYDNLTFDNIVSGFEKALENMETDKLIGFFDVNAEILENWQDMGQGKEFIESYFVDLFSTVEVGTMVVENINRDENSGIFSLQVDYILLDETEITAQYNLSAKKDFFWFVNKINIIVNQTN
ncbi:MAG: hypothetical protein PWQ77_908 [Kosmotogales bacterium]|nr:hypothetical protein [Kosmotogales bacterium]